MKKKYLKEDNTMLDMQRNVSGVGSGSKDEPFVQMSIPLNQGMGEENTTINYPYQINKFKDRLFEVFAKLIELRKDFNQCLDNPSVKESQKIALNKAITRIDFINKKLIQIPEFLELFSVEK